MGARLQNELTIFKTFEGNGYMGKCSYMYLMKDADNNLYKWNTSNWYKEGTYKFNYTIKEYTEYNGIHQTVLTRCTIVK